MECKSPLKFRTTISKLLTVELTCLGVENHNSFFPFVRSTILLDLFEERKEEKIDEKQNNINFDPQPLCVCVCVCSYLLVVTAVVLFTGQK